MTRTSPSDTEHSLARGFASRLCAIARGATGRDGVSTRFDDALYRAAYAASRATEDGDVCALLAEAFPGLDDAALADLRAVLLASGVVSDADAEDVLPLVVDRGDRVWLGRYFDYERRLSRALAARAAHRPPVAIEAARAAITATGNAMRVVDLQQIAVALALRNGLTIVTGGPGTGKTTTAVAILAALLTLSPGLRIALAAPTGKAAQRMREAILTRVPSLSDDIRALMPVTTFTVHRLLGASRQPGVFTHDAENPVPYDVVMVDEASMLDLALAARLVEAVPRDARLVFLGDGDQLAAVEAGSVFRDIGSHAAYSEECITHLTHALGSPPALEATRDGSAPLRDCVVRLTQPMRFDDGAGISGLAAAINEGRAKDAAAMLDASAHAGLTLIDDGGAQPGPAAFAAMLDGFAEYFDAILATPHDPAAAFQAFGSFRLLCAVRESPRGVEELNARIAGMFRRRLDELPNRGDGEWYDGRPVMIMKNDHQLRLLNGDVGIVRIDARGGCAVYFQKADGTFGAVAPQRLPEHETAFASTVHKAQGSEYRRVALVLPAARSRVLTKELVYTAVTRAREAVSIIGDVRVFAEAVATPTVRRSGLREMLERESGRITTSSSS